MDLEECGGFFQAERAHELSAYRSRAADLSGAFRSACNRCAEALQSASSTNDCRVTEPVNCIAIAVRTRQRCSAPAALGVTYAAIKPACRGESARPVRRPPVQTLPSTTESRGRCLKHMSCMFLPIALLTALAHETRHNKGLVIQTLTSWRNESPTSYASVLTGEWAQACLLSSPCSRSGGQTVPG
jgi:hypothetical protein